jgi:hypothetical protein
MGIHIRKGLRNSPRQDRKSKENVGRYWTLAGVGVEGRKWYQRTGSNQSYYKLETYLRVGRIEARKTQDNRITQEITQWYQKRILCHWNQKWNAEVDDSAWARRI